MANEFNKHDELMPLPADIRAAFEEYPRPKASAGFDARFWSELDARERRYHGFGGLWRRFMEVEIEGIAVWRLGYSLLSGAALCALAIAILSLSPTTAQREAQVPLKNVAGEIPTAASHFVRGMWDDLPADVQQSYQQPTKTKKERTSCVSFVHGWA